MYLTRDELIEIIYKSFLNGKLTMSGAMYAADNIIEKEAEKATQPSVQRTRWQCPPPCQRLHGADIKACVVCNSPRPLT